MVFNIMPVDNTLYNSSRVSFSFDFYTLSSRKSIAEKIAKYLKFDAVYLNRYTPNDGNKFKVVRNDYGGDRMTQIQTPYLPYNEAINVSFKIFDIISTFGYTTSKCCATLYIKYAGENSNQSAISKINTLKLIIGVDECSNSQYRKTLHEDDYVSSLNYIYPINIMTSNNNINDFINFNDFKYPSSSKFDIKFDGLKDNYIAIRCCQKKGYEKEKRNFKLFLDSILNKVSSILRNSAYTSDETTKIKTVLSNQRNLLKSIWTYDDFSKNYPKIQLMVDLRNDYNVIKFYYPKIREYIFKLICYGKMTDGGINFDSEIGKVQVRDAVLVNSQYLEGVDFYYCDLCGTFSQCRMNECNIFKSKLDNCEIMYGTKLKDCRVYDCPFHGIEIYAYDSFIKNSDKFLIEAFLNNCVVCGKLEFNSVVDEKTQIIKI